MTHFWEHSTGNIVEVNHWTLRWKNYLLFLGILVCLWHNLFKTVLFNEILSFKLSNKWLRHGDGVCWWKLQIPSKYLQCKGNLQSFVKVSPLFLHLWFTVQGDPLLLYLFWSEPLFSWSFKLKIVALTPAQKNSEWEELKLHLSWHHCYLWVEQMQTAFPSVCITPSSLIH